MSPDIVWWPLAKQVSAIRSHDIAACELAEAYHERVTTYDEHLASHVLQNPSLIEEALAIDAASQRGEPLGTLAGSCISVKDNCTTFGMATRAGTEVEVLKFPEEDSHVVSRIREANGLIVGKTRLHEFAWGISSPPTRNPWRDECDPGGSSGGSAAAVAAALCSGAIGTDTGGSIRIPAALCGIVGMKATFGLVGRGGIIPHSWSLDHVGPLTRTVEDAAVMLESMVGPDANDPSSLTVDDGDYVAACATPIRGGTVGVIRNHFGDRLSEDVERQFQAAIAYFREKGVSIREFQVPSLEYGLGAIFAIQLCSATTYHDRSVRDGLSSRFQEDVRDLVDMGRLVTGVDYLHAEQLRSVMCAEFAKIFAEVDVVITPTSPITAWRSGCKEIEVRGVSESVHTAAWRFTYPFNLTGLPAITIPAGFDRSGLPIGLQIAGAPFAEKKVFAFASAYESDHDWNKRRPHAYV